jgi:hypothetical protein
MEPVKFNLQPQFFNEKNFNAIETGSLTAGLFRYSTGVCGVKLTNDKGWLELLPFQGQQIWKAHFRDRDLQMRQPAEEPVETIDFLENFGCFMLHCGVLRVGAPTATEPHLLHGELPNAPFRDAFLIYGEDQKGRYLSLSGKYYYNKFFGNYYLAEPEVKLYENSSVFQISMKVKNLSKLPMELMYLCHINFVPVDGSRLEYSAKYDAGNIKPRTSIPSHLKPEPEYIDFINNLKTRPEIHHQIDKNLRADPEVVFYIEYLADKDGKCYTLQVHPDGKSDYVGHMKDQLPKVVRWISRTPDHDSIAIAEAGTCEVDGYVQEKEKGNIKILNPGEEYHCEIDAGALDENETVEMLRKISEIQKS